MKKILLGFVLVFGIIVSQGVTATAQDSVVGYWKTSGLGMINEVNTVTGQTKNNRGQMFSYTFAADGTYTFPHDRLQPGQHEITIRASGYVMPAATVDVAATGSTRLNLELRQAKPVRERR